MACRLRDFLSAHGRQLVHLLAEIGRVGIECDQLADEGVDPFLELALLLILERNQAGRLFRRHGLQRLRCIQSQLRRRLGGGLSGHGCRISCLSREIGACGPSVQERTRIIYVTHLGFLHLNLA